MHNSKRSMSLSFIFLLPPLVVVTFIMIIERVTLNLAREGPNASGKGRARGSRMGARRKSVNLEQDAVLPQSFSDGAAVTNAQKR